MGLDKTFTSVAVAMICKLRTEKVVMRLLLSIVWGNTIEYWVNIVQNNYPGIIGEPWEWQPLQRLNVVPRYHLEMQTTPPPGHSEFTSALEPLLVVANAGVGESFMRVIDKMIYGTDFEQVNLLQAENSNLTLTDLVLATGPGNPPAVRVWTAKTGRFGSRPVQETDPLTLGGPNPDPYPSTRGFRRVWLDPSVPISGSAFRVSHLWLHSDMLLLIVK